MVDLQFRMLGPFEVVRDGVPTAITARRNRMMLAVLAAQPNRIVPLDRLITALWDEKPPRTARAQVHICVSSLRSVLGDPDSIRTHPVGYALNVPDESVDSRLFERLMDEVKALDHGQEPEQALRLLERALGLWRGPAYDTLSGPVVESMAVLLEQRRVKAVEQRAEIRLKLGREDPDELAALCAEHPLRERLHGFLMVSLYRAGRQADALAAYQSVRSILRQELGIEPGHELRAIERSILNQDSSLSLSRTHGPGVHRIVLVPHQLPGAAPDFTGRDEYVAQLCETLLRSADTRAHRTPLALVTGMCGIGKTALAVEVGHLLLSDFPDGQLFARLDGSTPRPAEPASVLDRFLRGLGADAREIPDDLDSRADMLRSLLGGKRILIVLDDAASEAQVTPLLPGLAGCAVVITSRRRLFGLPGVVQFELGRLPAAAADLLGRIVAGDRLRADPQARREIVRFCDGLPFALRIAGSRLASHPHWGAAELVRRMADEKQRLDQLAHGDLDIRALLAVAYETLSAPARRTLRLLCLLNVPDFGAWHAAAALGACADDAASLVDELVECRLVEPDLRQSGSVRFRLHGLVRLFAAERCATEDDAADRRRAVDDVLAACLAILRESHHRGYGGEFVTLGDPVPPCGLAEADLDKLLRDPTGWFTDERPALSALVAQAANTGRPQAAWNIAVGSVVFFEALGCFDDWKTTHELALTTVQRHGDTRGEAAVLCSLGSLGIARGGAWAEGGLLRALALFESLDDTLGRALTLRNLAHLDRVHGRHDSAFQRYRGALAGFRDAGDPVGEAHALSGLAQTYLEVGDVASAERYTIDSLHLAESLGNLRLESQALYRLGNVLVARGDSTGAHAYLSKSLDIVQTAGDPIGQAHVMAATAAVLVDLGDLDAADEMLDTVTELCERLTDGRVRGRVILTRARVHEERGSYATAETLLLSASAVFSDNGDAVWQERALEAMSRLRRSAAKSRRGPAGPPQN